MIEHSYTEGIYALWQLLPLWASVAIFFTMVMFGLVRKATFLCYSAATLLVVTVGLGSLDEPAYLPEKFQSSGHQLAIFVVGAFLGALVFFFNRQLQPNRSRLQGAADFCRSCIIDPLMMTFVIIFTPLVILNDTSVAEGIFTILLACIWLLCVGKRAADKLCELDGLEHQQLSMKTGQRRNGFFSTLEE
jgi:hypothetical protein